MVAELKTGDRNIGWVGFYRGTVVDWPGVWWLYVVLDIPAPLRRGRKIIKWCMLLGWSIMVLSLLFGGKVGFRGAVIVSKLAICCDDHGLGQGLVVGAMSSGVHKEVCKVGELGAGFGGLYLGLRGCMAWLFTGVR